MRLFYSMQVAGFAERKLCRRFKLLRNNQLPIQSEARTQGEAPPRSYEVCFHPFTRNTFNNC